MVKKEKYPVGVEDLGGSTQFLEGEHLEAFLLRQDTYVAHCPPMDFSRTHVIRGKTWRVSHPWSELVKLLCRV
jgi:hypothetical protein